MAVWYTTRQHLQPFKKQKAQSANKSTAPLTPRVLMSMTQSALLIQPMRAFQSLSGLQAIMWKVWMASTALWGCRQDSRMTQDRISSCRCTKRESYRSLCSAGTLLIRQTSPMSTLVTSLRRQSVKAKKSSGCQSSTMTTGGQITSQASGLMTRSTRSQKRTQ